MRVILVWPTAVLLKPVLVKSSASLPRGTLALGDFVFTCSLGAGGFVEFWGRGRFVAAGFGGVAPGRAGAEAEFVPPVFKGTLERVCVPEDFGATVLSSAPRRIPVFVVPEGRGCATPGLGVVGAVGGVFGAAGWMTVFSGSDSVAGAFGGLGGGVTFAATGVGGFIGAGLTEAGGAGGLTATATATATVGVAAGAGAT